MQDDQRSERRRLTKKQRDRTNTLPLRNRSNSNSSAQKSIKHHRSPTLPSPGASSHNSIDSTLAQSAAGASYNHQASYSIDRGLQYEPRYSVTAKTSTDLLGQRFDSAAILSNLNAVTYPADQPLLPPQLRPPLLQQHSDITAAQPTQLRYQNPNQSTTTLANPDVDLSQSLAATGRRMDDITGPRADLGARSPRQRLSDEAKDGKALKKKTGFSSFVNNLVGTPKRPAISAPENPVHVTHVGYDQETGEFTVSATCRD
jgi:p21-activated kinase 1